MTIAQTTKEISGIISDHSVYGAEAIINALVFACKNHPYLKEDDLINLIKAAERREANVI